MSYTVDDARFATSPSGVITALSITTDGNIAMISTSGDLLGLVDIQSAGVQTPAGPGLGPNSTGGDSLMSPHLFARGVDNDPNPNERDGKM